MIGQPENCKGTDNHQDQTGALCSALELCILQATDDGGITGVDEAEGHQAAHDGLKQVLEDSVADTVPVVHITTRKRDVFTPLQSTVRGAEEKMYNYNVKIGIKSNGS